jgi:hypothetical protein
MCDPEYDEHDTYTPTGQTWVERAGKTEIVWRVYRCQCGARTNDIFELARELD